MSLIRSLLLANQLEEGNKPSRLPSGYKELEYIHNDGRGAYIGSIVYSYDNSEMEYHFKNMLPSKNKFDVLFSCNDCALYSSYSEKKIQAHVGEGYVYDNFNVDIYNIDCTIKYKGLSDKTEILVNNNSVGFINGLSTDRWRVYFLFDKKYSWKGAICDISEIKLYKKEGLNFHLIPCKNPEGEVGLYDLINGGFYPSDNPDVPFIAGPEAITEELSPNSYVRKGLVFQLDGIEKGADTTAWTDLIKGVKFSYHNCILNQDNIEFDGTTSYADSEDRTFYDQDKCTIEVAIYKDEQKAQFSRIFASPNNRNIGCILDNNQKYIDCNSEEGRGYRFIYKEFFNATISLRRNLGVLNKKAINEYGNSKNSLATKTIIGAKFKNSQHFKGKIYSIRIYNRLLTEEEMKHNQEIDNKRFFGGTLW